MVFKIWMLFLFTDNASDFGSSAPVRSLWYDPGQWSGSVCVEEENLTHFSFFIFISLFLDSLAILRENNQPQAGDSNVASHHTLDYCPITA